MSYVLKFLKKFNPKINDKLLINEFSEPDNKNIQIQDGPLACYCSHLRAMIYGYNNFKDYTVLVEDDIKIINTEKIEKYIKEIPNDWDIICLSSIAKNVTYKEPYYKFTDEFHSTHFYIIKNKCMPLLFSCVYPITDQIDVLISDNIHKLNVLLSLE